MNDGHPRPRNGKTFGNKHKTGGEGWSAAYERIKGKKPPKGAQ